MKPIVLVLLSITTPLLATAAPPEWLTELAGTQVPAYEAKVPAVVLLHEEQVKVDPRGRVVTTQRYAVKVLNRDGRAWALARVVYRTKSSTVRQLRAWMVFPSGKTKTYGKKEILDLSLVENDVYNEARVRTIVATSEADPGAVFGYESIKEDRSVFTQFSFVFQGRLPVLNSRFVLRLPTDWVGRSVTYNHEPIEPLVAGSRYTWVLHDLPYIDREDHTPSLASLAPRVAVSYFPAEGQQGPMGPTFKDWSEVSVWLSSLSDPQAVSSPELAAQVKSLAMGTQTKLEQIEGIGSFVQKINYISIQTGLARGGGYTPHSAAEVFTNAYGDCKDKATLMRTMLREAGIESFPVPIYSGDRHYVRPDWPSPQQFNHAIIGIRVSEDVEAPAVGEYTELGRLLFFDPTHPYVQLGYLPDDHQDSWALVLAGEQGDLVRMPTAESELNRVDRDVEINLNMAGSIQVSVREISRGQAAAEERRRYRSQNHQEYKQTVEKWISRGASGSTVSRVDVNDDPKGNFELEVEFTAPSYGQNINNVLLIFRPAVVASRSPVFSEESRDLPIEVAPQAYRETVRVRFPSRAVVDEHPDPVDIEADFGTFRASWEPARGELVFRRELELEAAVIPASEYRTVQEFFKYVADSQAATVVLTGE